jgi:predicted Rossmann fold nucleotide-binding protein DprA/Smf involved in DNA uptake
LMIDILGFTGTREGMTSRQRPAVALRIAGLRPRVFLHGGAPGADTEVHYDILEYVNLPAAAVIEIYLCNTKQRDYWKDKYATFMSGRNLIVHPIMKALARNKVIASRCDHLLATPATSEEQQRSGTWATIRYARKRRKPVTIIDPDGTVRCDIA